MNPQDLAQENFRWLRDNPYPGRGIAAGLDESGNYLVQVYWIMGRSENSRNRVFKSNDSEGRLYTEAADPSKVKDPSLIIYNAMCEVGRYEKSRHFIVSNGDQTDTVADWFSRNPPHLGIALCGKKYEPDAPNFTQRITAVSSLSKGPPFVQMSILRKSVLNYSCEHMNYFYPKLEPGFGYCITTYAGDGDPLPSFRGDPMLVPLCGAQGDILTDYWNVLNEGNRVSIAVNCIEIGNGRSSIIIKNKYKQLQTA